MTSVALGLAIIALIGVVALGLAVVELHRIARSLQDGLRSAAQRTLGPTSPSSIRHASLRSSDGRRTVYIATSPNCPICAERIEEIAPIVLNSPDRLIVVTNRTGSESFVGGTVIPVVDSEIVGQLAIQATPAVVVIDGYGRELMRRVIANPEKMRQTADWLRKTATNNQPESIIT